MPKTVTIPFIGDVEFPDSMTDADITAKARQLYTKAQADQVSHNEQLKANNAKLSSEEKQSLIARTISAFGEGAALGPVGRAIDAFSRNGPEAIAAGVSRIHHRKDMADVLGGTDQVVNGAAITSLPFALPGIAAAPVTAALATGGGILAHHVTKPVVLALGGSLEGANLAADVAGLGVGARIAGSPVTAADDAATFALNKPMTTQEALTGGINIASELASPWNYPSRLKQLGDLLAPKKAATRAVRESTPEEASPKLTEIMRPPLDNRNGQLGRDTTGAPEFRRPTSFSDIAAQEQPGVELPPEGDLPTLSKVMASGKTQHAVDQDGNEIPFIDPATSHPIPTGDLGRNYHGVTGPASAPRSQDSLAAFQAQIRARMGGAAPVAPAPPVAPPMPSQAAPPVHEPGGMTSAYPEVVDGDVARPPLPSQPDIRDPASTLAPGQAPVPPSTAPADTDFMAMFRQQAALRARKTNVTPSAPVSADSAEPAGETPAMSTEDAARALNTSLGLNVDAEAGGAANAAASRAKAASRPSRARFVPGREVHEQPTEADATALWKDAADRGLTAEEMLARVKANTAISPATKAHLVRIINAGPPDPQEE